MKYSLKNPNPAEKEISISLRNLGIPYCLYLYADKNVPIMALNSPCGIYKYEKVSSQDFILNERGQLTEES